MSVVYEVLEAESIKELERLVQSRLLMGATLVGGVATAVAVTRRSAYDPDRITQCFYQAVTYEEAGR